ncbi:MAG TPA: hypothetical protein VMZ25_11395 [Terriglobales bacterium]|nr:hypothetical protein [Terriglobales bacterium]
MKYRFSLGLAWLALTLAGVSQVHGVPASATSPGVGGFAPRGIPSSVSSLGPEGWALVDRTFVRPTSRDRLGRVVMRAPIPLFYGAPYYPVVYVPVVEEARVEVPRTERNVRNEPQKIIVEIRDTRPLPPTPAKEVVEEKRSAPRQEVERPRPATVFIFQDGSRKELKDFAITATELIDLSGGMIWRSPLAALDRAASRRVNAENGVELHFAASASD